MAKLSTITVISLITLFIIISFIASLNIITSVKDTTDSITKEQDITTFSVKDIQEEKEPEESNSTDSNLQHNDR